MNFSYETQGALTYLVCEIEPTEQVDTLILGMLTNNHILGLAPVIYTEMNGQRYLKYNISAKVTAGQFFAGSVSKDIALRALSNILSAICSADEYMIDLNCFSVLPEHVYLNVSNCETALVCVPVISDKKIEDGLKSLLNNLLSAQVAGGGADSAYAQQILDYIEAENITAYSLYDYIKNFKPVQANAPAPTITAAQPQAAQSAPAAQATISAPTISPFENTISIDDMPQLGGAASVKPVISATPETTPVNVNTPAPDSFAAPVPQRPAIQQAPPVQVPPMQTPPVQVPPMQTPPVQVPSMHTPPAQVPPMYTPAQGNGFSPNPIQKQAPISQPKNDVPPMPTRREGGMAIPPAIVPEPAKKPKKEKAKKAKKEKATPEENNTDKKIGIFDLLAHYNKENVALYKAQKEADKAEKNAAKAAQQAENNVNGSSLTPPPVNNGVNPYANPNPYGVGGGVPVMQPVPVQNSFNETTVLSAFGGETTVLSAEPQIVGPYLLRIKTGEKISLNKPVFRIGKEKSYVDYFIADNTAISRSHANIHTENGEFFVEDTNSTNHTYVNGSIISSNIKVKLTSGDKIKLANEEFTFVV